jgi:subtilisin family serine protease
LGITCNRNVLSGLTRGLWKNMRLCGAILVLGLLPLWASATTITSTNSYVEGEALVKYRQVLDSDSVRQAVSHHSAVLLKHFEVLSKAMGGSYAHLRSSSLSTAALLAELRADPGVEVAEPNYIRRIHAMRPPNDTYLQRLWGLHNTGQEVYGTFGTAGADIHFLTAWGLARPTTNEFVVGVIDTGADYNHPDLAQNIWVNSGEIAGNGMDNDGNGYTNDVHGFDFADGIGDVADSSFHGTHVAGIIAAAGNNNLGIIGVDFRAHVMVLKVSSDGQSILDSAVTEALQYATMMKGRGVNIVALNASFGGGYYSSIVRNAIQAAGNAGIIFCATAGNDSRNNDITPTYPASYRLNNMIVVAASDSYDGLASFSDYGPSTVDLAAPGTNIFSTTPTWLQNYDSHVELGTASYMGVGLQYSGLTSLSGINGVLYNCGLGYPGDFPPGVSGNIALIQRGTLTFSNKLSNAMAAGAVAAVVYNNVPGLFSGTLGSAGSWIPGFVISQADGAALLGAVPAPVTVVNAFDPNLVYYFLSGTSMAGPQVAAAAAFAARNFPTETVAQRIQRILGGVTPLPGLQGKVVTGGRLNLAGIVDRDGNGLPDWWEQTYFEHLTGTDPSADADMDGQSNLAEWLAGTNPTNSASYLALTPIRAEGTNSLMLQWPSTADRYYRLLRSTNLLSGFDQLVLTNIAATPPLNTVTDPAPAFSSSVFYRLELEP